MPAWLCLDAVDGEKACYDTMRTEVHDSDILTYTKRGSKVVPITIHCNSRVYTLHYKGETVTHMFGRDSIANTICQIERGLDE